MRNAHNFAGRCAIFMADLARTSAAKMLAADWDRYVGSDDWRREKDLAALPAGTRRLRVNLHRLSKISADPLSWQRIAEIAASL